MVEEPQKTTNRKSRATLGVLQQPFYRQKEGKDEKAMEEAEAREDIKGERVGTIREEPAGPMWNGVYRLRCRSLHHREAFIHWPRDNRAARLPWRKSSRIHQAHDRTWRAKLSIWPPRFTSRQGTDIGESQGVGRPLAKKAA